MGTVIFHLLLAILLLSMEISKVNFHREMEIVMETPAPEEMEKKVEEEERKDEIRKKSSEEEVNRMLRSLASNENIAKEKKNREVNVQKYIDEVMEEMNTESRSGRYQAKRDKNYKRDSLQNLRDKKEQRLDSLKSTFYSGESSVSYDLKDRFARYLPIPVFKCEYGGKVVVTISVNRKGIVQKAEVVESESKADDCLWEVATDAAKRSRFNENPDAPGVQTGRISYHFIKQ